MFYLSVLLLFTGVGIPITCFAQEEPQYDEITVFFSVPRIGGSDIPAVVYNDLVFLPITDVFNFLKIKNTFTAGYDSISGFFIDEQAKFIVDRINNRIVYKGKAFEIKPGDLLRTETNLYLKSNYFEEIFGLECTFNFRSLSVTLNTKIELPVIREMRQEQMRKNISQIKGEIKADTTIKRSYPFFHFGMADWSAISTQQLQGTTDTRLAVNLGTLIAGGEANISLNYSNTTPFTEREQNYLWRYANNDFKAVKQVMLGKITTDAMSTLSSPVVGLQFTNTPTTYRQSYGSYTLSDVTEPGWLVELYVNNVLVDYKKADASGFYTFDVPLVYGSTSVKLQFYGPWGEERSKEQSISIPFNFLPVGHLEYKVSAGMVEDTQNSRFARTNFDYGVSSRITVGGGVEYLSSLSTNNVMPFVSTSLRLASSLLISGEYTYGVRLKSVLNYRLPSDIQFELNYTKYDKNQTAISTSYLEERKFAVSIPLNTSKFSLFSRLSLNQFIMPQSKYASAELLLSSSLFGVNTNLTTSAMLPSQAAKDIYSNLALSLRLPGAFILTPQTQFNYIQGEFVSVKCGLEKHMFKRGFLNMFYEHNFQTRFSSMEIGFRYDFSFAQIGLTARRSNKVTTIVETASGSIMADVKSKYLGANSRTSVGKGGITFLPFLDINGNGKRDSDEPKANGLWVHLNGGRIENNDKDTTIMVFDLEPYANYLVTLDGTNFDNISWQLRKRVLSVAVDPNKFKLVEVPVVIFGEATGMVYLNEGGKQDGLGRIIVNFYRSDGSFVKSTLTEPDGYFNYLGFTPGEYMAAVDTAQMKKLNMNVTPVLQNFTISPSKDGDLVDGLEFVLVKESSAVSKPTANIPTVNNPIPAKQSESKPEENTPIVTDSKTVASGNISYMVQLLAVSKPINIKKHFAQLIIDVPYLTIEESLGKDGLYRYSSQPLISIRQAINLQNRIRKKGCVDCFVVTR